MATDPTPSITAQSMTWPTVCRVISQGFGVPNSRYVSGFHTGLDIACIPGSPIRAVLDGTVQFAGRNGDYGNQVRLTHGSNKETWYNHLVTIAVKNGEVVKQGKILGYEGSTGNSTGPHLHLELRIGGKAVDPMPYLKGAPLPAGGANASTADFIQTDNPLSAVGDALHSADVALEWLTNTQNWMRMGEVLLGAVLVLIGIMKMQVAQDALGVVSPGVKIAKDLVKGGGSDA